MYQWDYGQILQFEGLDLPSAYTVHFSNVGVGGTAKTMVGNADGVDIPDEYLTTGQTVYAWVYLHAGEDDGETAYAVVIPVTKRPHPTEDEPTPVQQGVVDQAIAALNAAVEQTGADVETTNENVTAAHAAQEAAETAAGQAGASATAAAQSAYQAAQSATSAGVSATDAIGSAQSAASAADFAEQSATDAEDSAVNAAGSAAVAGQSAASAAQSAEAAQDAVESVQDMGVEAETLAPGSEATVEKTVDPETGVVTLEFGIPRGDTGPAGYSPTATVSKSGATATITITDVTGTTMVTVSDGATGATPDISIGTVATLDPGEDATVTISGTAAAPVLSFGIPKGDPGEVTQAEFDALAEYVHDMSPVETVSGAVASVTDAVPLNADDVSVAITPVQDLHGQANPYPAGGGKNKLTSLPTPANLVWFCEPNGFTFKAGITYCFSVTDGTVNGSISIYGADRTTQLAYSNTNTVTYTPESDTVGFPRCYQSTGVSQTAIDSAMLEIGSSRSSFAPYSNVCPITGWTGANVTRTGKNLLKNNATSGSSNGITWTVNSDGSIALSGTATAAVSVTINSSFNIAMLYKGTVTLVCSYGAAYNPTIAGLNFQSDIYADGVYKTTLQNGQTYVTFSGNTIEVGLSRLRIQSGTVIPAGTVYYPQIEIGSTATAYEPYSANTYSVSWQSEAGTVYGGTLDLTKGKLTVDRAMVEITKTSRFRTWSTGNDRLPLFDTEAATLKYGKLVCNALKMANNYSNVVNTDSSAALNQGGIVLHFPGIKGDNATEENTQAYIASLGYNINIVYELANPVTYDLTPQDIAMLKGSNNIWADCGDTTLTYRADIQAYIDQRIRAAQSATRSIIAGIETAMKASKAYSAGDLLIVGDTLYKATTAIANGATFTPGTNVNATTVAEQLILLANA